MELSTVDLNTNHLNTKNIRILNFLIFGFQMVGLYAMSCVLDQPFKNGWALAMAKALSQPFQNWTRFQMLMNKMEAICLYFKWSDFRITDPI